MKNRKLKRVKAAKMAAETKRVLRETSAKFPIGEMVYQKYYPKNIGIVVSHPSSFRTQNKKYLWVYVEVLWMTNSFYGDGETLRVRCSELMLKKGKKAL